MSRYRFVLPLLASALALACNVVLDNKPGILVDAGMRRDGGASPVGATTDAGTIDDDEDTGCGPGSKLCDGLCVSTNDPLFGCAVAACTRCAPAHGRAACNAGTCAVAICDLGFADCNRDPNDGCEKDLRRDRKHCGACGAVCIFGGKCKQGVCTWNED